MQNTKVKSQKGKRASARVSRFDVIGFVFCVLTFVLPETAHWSARRGARADGPPVEQANLNALDEAIRREARYMARSGGLPPEAAERLAEAGAKAIARRPGELAVGRNNVIIHRFFNTTGGLKRLRATYSEPAEQMVRRELTPALKALSYEAWEKFDAERQRRERRRQQADVFVQVAALDDALLLSGEQRDAFCQLFSRRWPFLWRGYAAGSSPPDALRLCVNATSVMGLFSIPLADLQAILREPQQDAFACVQSPATIETVFAEPEAAQARPRMLNGRGHVARGNLAPFLVRAPDAARHVVREGLPLDDLQSRLESLLGRMIEEIDRCVALEDQQKQKLLLAGALDVEQCVRQQVALEKTPAEHFLQRFPSTVAGAWYYRPPVFDVPASMFQKALRGRLTPSQREKLAGMERERALFRERALQHALAVAIAERAALTDDEAQRVCNWLERQVCAAAQAESVAEWGRAALRRVSELPVEELQPLVDAWQWRDARHYTSALAVAARRLFADPQSERSVADVEQELLAIPAEP